MSVPRDPEDDLSRALAEIRRLHAEVDALRLTLGEHVPDATVEPIGCPAPGACSTVAEITRLRDGVKFAVECVNLQKADLARALAENEQLRAIVSQCAGALGGGTFAHPEASIDFMGKVPAEITARIRAAVLAEREACLSAVHKSLRHIEQPTVTYFDNGYSSGVGQQYEASLAAIRNRKD